MLTNNCSISVTAKVRLFAALLVCSIATSTNANLRPMGVGEYETVTDYYTDEIKSPIKSEPYGSFEEKVDPFSGAVRLSHTDLIIPGTGGLDIEVKRIYSTPQRDVMPYMTFSPFTDTNVGLGWKMHFGRIVVSQQNAVRICAQNQFSVNILDNPSLELPNGNREILVLANDPDAYLITKNYWKAECNNAPEGGLIVTSPDGVVYLMDQYQIINDEVSYFTSNITDLNGNTLDFSYVKNSQGYLLVQEIVASDGRLVQFNYAVTENNKRLTSIVANGQTWTYEYTAGLEFDKHYLNEFGSISTEQIAEYKRLSRVTRPDGKSWEYFYSNVPFSSDVRRQSCQECQNEDPEQPGFFNPSGEEYIMVLDSIKHPEGGVISYTYSLFDFNPPFTAAGFPFFNIVVDTRSTSGPDVTPGLWTYDYSAASENSNNLDVTTVTAPDGIYKYYHNGMSYNAGVWKTGLNAATEVYSLTGDLIRQEQNEWSFITISGEEFFRNRRNGFPLYFDPDTYAPVLTKKINWSGRQGVGMTYVTDYLAYDNYGNPGQTIESTNVAGENPRTTAFTYYYDKAIWIVKRLEDETIAGIGTIDRAFNALGQLVSENKYGVNTVYSYTLEGDLASVTDARNFVTTYSNYFRGASQNEYHPVTQSTGNTIQRSINPTGTVQWERNARGYTTNYQWDDLNRLIAIDYPIHNDVTISWDANSPKRTKQRGALIEEEWFDGFGRLIKKEIRSSAADKITTLIEYNAVGQKIFESYPNATSPNGTSYQYDVLGRIISVSQPLSVAPFSVSKTFQYDTDTDIIVTDERGNDTVLFYRAYGSPDNKVIERIDSPEGIRTAMSHNDLMQVTSAVQGVPNGTGGVTGYYKNYGYNANYFLTSLDISENGLTIFGRDEVGNLISKQVGTSPVTAYQYDGQNRLIFTDYVNAADDVTMLYDANGNVEQVGNGESTRTYSYDENDNLINESIQIGVDNYNIGYVLNGLDHVTSVTYPTGRVIAYNPDVFGRPTSVGQYVTSVTYHPTGEPSTMEYDNGQTTTILLDERRFISSIQAGINSSTVFLDYAYDNAGNITSTDDRTPPGSLSTFSYDGVNRLSTANGSWGAGSYGYDETGNITSQTLGATTYGYNIVANAIYKITGDQRATYGYDVYGNIVDNDSHTFVYNDAGNLVEATEIVKGNQTPQTVAYGYDGNNMRVRRNSGFDYTRYIFDNTGSLLAEVPSDSSAIKEYYYLGSRLVASTRGLPPPIANAGTDQTVSEGSLVTLDGSASTDNFGGIDTYNWQQISGQTVTLNGSTTATPTFTAPTQVDGIVLTFELGVTNLLGSFAKDQVSVTVNMLDTDSDGMSDFWETQYFGNLLQDATTDPDGDGFTNLEEFIAGEDPTVPAPLGPIENASVLAGDTENSLTWDTVDRALAYDIYWSTTPDVTTATGNRIAGVSSPYSHTGLTNGDSYYYIIVANNLCCESVSGEMRARPGTSGWSTPATRENLIALGEYHGGKSMALGASWLDGISTLYSNDFLSPDNWGNDITLGSSYSSCGDVAVSADGSAIAAWFDVTDTLVVRNYDPLTGWGVVNTLRTSVPFHAKCPAIEMDDSGNGILIFGSTGPYVDVYGYRYDKATGWEAGQLILPAVPTNTRGDQYALDMSGTGTAIAVASDLRTVMYIPGSGWQPADELVAGGYTPVSMNGDTGTIQSYLRSLDIHVAEDGTIIVVWGADGPMIRSKTYFPVTGWEAMETIHSPIPYTHSLPLDVEISPLGSGSTLVSWIQVENIYTSLGAPMYSIKSGTAWSLAAHLDLTQGNEYAKYNPSTANVSLEGFVWGGGIQDQFSQADMNGGAVNLVFREHAIHQDVQLGEMVTLVAHRFLPDGSVRAPVRLGEFESMGSQTGDCTDDQFVFAETVSDENNGILTAYGPCIAKYVVNPSAPVSHAGADQVVVEGGAVTLDGSLTTDPQGDTLTYEWSQLTGPVAVISSPTTALTQFDAPLVTSPTELVFQLKVVDTTGLVGFDSTHVTVKPNSVPPVANAGTDQTAYVGNAVYIDPTGSFDPDGIIVSYQWRQTAGTTVSSAITSGNGLQIGTGGILVGTVLTFELIVTDDSGYSATDTVNVTLDVANGVPPTAVLSPDTALYDEVWEGYTGSYNAFYSNDPDGSIVSYEWRQLTGTPVTITPYSDPVDMFISVPSLDVSSIATIELTVTDNDGNTDTDTFDVYLKAFDIPETDVITYVRSSKGRSTTYGITFRAYNQGDLANGYDHAMPYPDTYFRIIGTGSFYTPSTKQEPGCSGISYAETADFQLAQNCIYYKTNNGDPMTVEVYSVSPEGHIEPVKSEIVQ